MAASPRAAALPTVLGQTARAEAHSGSAATLLLDAHDLSRELRTSLRTIRRWDAAGILPKPIRLTSGAVRWTRDSVVAWLRDGCPRR
jgi:predicted DNA-binding transcriptional regulator AlpA